jgi:GSH-dependent disulfide-bond oxidoreductase
MIDLYTWDTSNGLRVAIMLEECGLPYRVHRVDLMKGEQAQPAFLALNPVGAIPVLVDSEAPGGTPLTLSQSGAILQYLADKTGRFMPRAPVARAVALQWLMFAITDCMLATAMIFHNTTLVPEKSQVNAGYFATRLARYFGVIDGRLAGREWLADELSIADFALFPIVRFRPEVIAQAGNLPHLVAWRDRLAARPAVAKVAG